MVINEISIIRAQGDASYHLQQGLQSSSSTGDQAEAGGSGRDRARPEDVLHRLNLPQVVPAVLPGVQLDILAILGHDAGRERELDMRQSTVKI